MRSSQATAQKPGPWCLKFNGRVLPVPVAWRKIEPTPESENRVQMTFEVIQSGLIIPRLPVDSMGHLRGIDGKWFISGLQLAEQLDVPLSFVRLLYRTFLDECSFALHYDTLRREMFGEDGGPRRVPDEPPAKAKGDKGK